MGESVFISSHGSTPCCTCGTLSGCSPLGSGHVHMLATRTSARRGSGGPRPSKHRRSLSSLVIAGQATAEGLLAGLKARGYLADKRAEPRCAPAKSPYSQKVPSLISRRAGSPGISKTYSLKQFRSQPSMCHGKHADTEDRPKNAPVENNGEEAQEISADA